MRTKHRISADEGVHGFFVAFQVHEMGVYGVAENENGSDPLGSRLTLWSVVVYYEHCRAHWHG